MTRAKSFYSQIKSKLDKVNVEDGFKFAEGSVLIGYFISSSPANSKPTRAGHFRYFLIFSIIINDFFVFFIKFI